MRWGPSLLQEKSSFIQNKLNLLLKIILYNTQTLQLNQSLIKWKLFTKDNSATSLIKCGSLIESSSLR